MSRAAPPSWEGEALILAAHDAGAHRVLRLLLETDELVPTFAYGAKRTRKRYVAPAQPLTLSHVTLRRRPAAPLGEREALARVARFEITHHFPQLAGDVVRFAVGSAMAEVVLHLFPDGAIEPGLFELVLRAWTRLDRPAAVDPEALLLLLELRLLDASGVLPPIAQLDTLSPAARDALEGWRAGHWTRLAPADVPATARTLESLIIAHAGRPLRARRVLDQLLPGR